MISIIIPTYNCESVLNRAILSIQNQTFKNWELLLIDGVSNDGTIDIIKGYSTDPRISWISEPDKGLYDAMNKGVQMARGEWVYFLGSDDWLFDSSVLSIIFERDHNNLRQGDLIRCRVMRNDIKSDIQPISLPEIAYDILLHQSVIYARTIVSRFPFDLRYPISADQVQFLYVIASGVKTTEIDVTLAVYSTGGASSKQLDIQYSRDKLGILNRLFENRLSTQAKFKALRNMSFVQIKYANPFLGIYWLIRAGHLLEYWRDVLYCLKHRYYRYIGSPMDTV